MIRVLLPAILAASIAPLLAFMLVVQAFTSSAHLTYLSATPSAVALDDIPAAHLAPLLDAGQTCDPVPWPVLAAIAKVEHDHGRNGRYAFPPVPGLADPENIGPLEDAPRDVTERLSVLAEWMCEGLPEQVEATAPTAPVAGIEFGDGETRTVRTAGEWTAAVAAAQPGDTIRIVENINAPLVYDGASGTAEAPITITSDSGAWIDPGNTRNRRPALDVRSVAHVQVAGVQVRGSQFGIWYRGVTGTAGAPARIHGNTVTGIGHSGIIVSGRTPSTGPSAHVRVESNTVTRTGRTTGEFGEGIYIGHGSTEWVDRTSDVVVVGNDISETTGEGVDVKPGTARVVVEANMIHDLAPASGGAISAHYTSGTTNPRASELAPVIVRGNAIWNQNINGRAGANDWAIWVGHGGVTVENNTIWGLRPGGIGIRVRGLSSWGSQPIQITGNTIWATSVWEATGQPSGASLVTATANRGPAGARGADEALPAPEGAPPVGQSGRADTGDGPGSAFGFVATIQPQGYASAEAANFMRQAVERYNPDAGWVDQVLEIAGTYGALPVATNGPYSGEPVSLDARGCPDGPVGRQHTTEVYGISVHVCIANDFRALMDHARRDGIDLSGWGWRDPEDQKRLRRQHCGPTRGFDPGDYSVGAGSCRPPTARPGSSRHERGLAIDFRYRGKGMTSRRNTGHLWLAQNAAAYGFYNLPSEPWHWSVDGH